MGIILAKQKYMINKIYSRISVLAILLSLVSIIIAGVAYTNSKGASLSDDAFSAKVEKGINDFIAKQQKEAQAQQDAQNKPQTEPTKVSVDDDPIMGDKNAKVTIVEFSDFQCPFCSKFHKETLPQIITEYINKGKAKLVYRDFPLNFHNFAKKASMAANCAKEQGGDKVYFKYHDMLYENNSEFSDENLKKWATDLGLKAEQFNKCYDSEKYAKEVEKDFEEGQSYGVSGTPAFFINGWILTGAQPFSAFKAKIDQELAK